jgi:hypothetical protein
MMASYERFRTLPDNSVQRRPIHGRSEGRMSDDLAWHLRRLRIRAGNPSLRTIEKNTQGQGPRRAMSQSAIQEKLSGRTVPNLGQLLALVQACAEYAESIGAPLPDDDIDEQVWRDRLEGTLLPGQPPTPQTQVHSVTEVPDDPVPTTAVAHRTRPTDRSLIYAQELKLALLKIGYSVLERSGDTGPIFVVEDGQHVIFLDAHYVNAMKPISTSIIEGVIETAASAVPPVLLAANEPPAKRAQLAIARSKNFDFMVWRNEGDNEELAARILPLMEHSQA